MYEISAQEFFDAAHAVRGYQGKCENLHGHRFRVVVTLRSPALDEIGIAYDFVALKAHLRGILAHFDHTSLNDTTPFDEINPTSENIARVIYSELERQLSGAPAHLHSVQVWETTEQWATYSPNP